MAPRSIVRVGRIARALPLGSEGVPRSLLVPPLASLSLREGTSVGHRPLYLRIASRPTWCSRVASGGEICIDLECNECFPSCSTHQRCVTVDCQDVSVAHSYTSAAVSRPTCAIAADASLIRVSARWQAPPCIPQKRLALIFSERALPPHCECSDRQARTDTEHATCAAAVSVLRRARQRARWSLQQRYLCCSNFPTPVGPSPKMTFGR